MSRSEKDGFGGKLTELDRMAVKAAERPAAGDGARGRRGAVRSAHLHARQSVAARRARCRGSSCESLAGADRAAVSHGSGRLDLARAITAADNPLTSRVIVNRVWMHHFGEPMVVDAQRFRHAQHAPVAPRAARLPGLRGFSTKAGRSRRCTA